MQINKATRSNRKTLLQSKQNKMSLGWISLVHGDLSPGTPFPEEHSQETSTHPPCVQQAKYGCEKSALGSIPPPS